MTKRKPPEEKAPKPANGALNGHDAPEPTVKPERGRPSLYTTELAQRICRELSDGKTLREVCRADEMPSEATVRGWVAENREGFSAQYTQAREAGYFAMADELLEIADDGTNDWTTRNRGEETIDVVDHDHIARSRLRVDTRKWLLAKALPKVFGDKVIHAGDDENPVAVKDVTDAELARRAAFLLRKSRPSGQGGVQANGSGGNGKLPLDS